MELGQIQITIKGIAGVAKPFPQGGVWRLTIPKQIVRKHNLDKTREKEHFYYIFLETDKGLLLIPLDKVVNPKNLRDALRFIEVSEKDLENIDVIFEQ